MEDGDIADDNTADDAVTSSSLLEQTPDALPELRPPPASEAAESKSTATAATAEADDIMVQIRARKSEVGLSQQICQLLRSWHFLEALFTPCQANE